MSIHTIICLLLCSVPFAFSTRAATLDFEDVGDLEVIGSSRYLSSGAELVGFQGYLSGVIGGSLNEFDFPPNSGFGVVVNTVDLAEIRFNIPALVVQGFFTYGGPITLSAYDASNNLLLSISSAFATNIGTFGDPGSSPNELLRLETTGASRIVIDATNTDFTLDDLTFEPSRPSTVIPEPGFGLAIPAILGVAWVARRRGCTLIL